MPIPDRQTAADYHYYAYRYDGDIADPFWELSPAQISRSNYQFYSMRRNLAGLFVEGTANQVPNIQLHNQIAPASEAHDDPTNNYYVQAISFGGTLGNPTEPVVLITGGIHAREWIAPAMAYLLAEYLIMHYTTAPTNHYQTAIRNLVDNRRIYIAPMLNPMGNWYTVFSPDDNARKWRKNRRRFRITVEPWEKILLDLARNPNDPFHNVNFDTAKGNITYEVPRYGTNPPTYDPLTITPGTNIIGVDCNRNFNTLAWGFETALNKEGQPTKQTYFGPNRTSENETQALTNFVNGFVDIDASIDYHSFGQYIVYPTEVTLGNQFIRRGLALQTLISTKVNPTWTFKYLYSLGTCRELLGYSAVGAVADYIANRKNGYAFTIELDPKDDNPGFELPQEKIMSVFENNIRAALGFIAAAGMNIDVTEGQNRKSHAINTAVTGQFVLWNVFGRGNRLPV